jgi:hypothetical protein
MIGFNGAVEVSDTGLLLAQHGELIQKEAGVFIAEE